MQEGSHLQDAAPIDFNRPFHFRREEVSVIKGVESKVSMHPGFERFEIVRIGKGKQGEKFSLLKS